MVGTREHPSSHIRTYAHGELWCKHCFGEFLVHMAIRGASTPVFLWGGGRIVHVDYESARPAPVFTEHRGAMGRAMRAIEGASFPFPPSLF